MTDHLFTKLDCKIIKAQIDRRYKYRCEFLKARTDPHKHAAEAGYVFDPAVQRFMSEKATSFDRFRANPRTSFFGIFAIVLPMLTYGYFINQERTEREKKIRCGELPYRERSFKFA